MSIAENISEVRTAGVSVGLSRLRSPLVAFVALLTLLASGLVFAFARAVDEWTWVAWSVVPLMAANAVWISGGAATALIGVFARATPHNGPPPNWRPRERAAVLLTLCGEDPQPVARYLAELSDGLHKSGLSSTTEIFVLSDTGTGPQSSHEERALASLIDTARITYRRRLSRTDKKPGNIADWLATNGANFDHMVVLDADSRMSPASIRHLIWAMERDPNLGLCQASISLVPGRTRFGMYQRVTSRLLSRTFGRGFAAWSGETGNYWGHNAIIRVRAFQAAARLPRLSGAAPFGGPVLSHDFIEAAWIRRAGWKVMLCPDLPGCAEDAPQTLDEFFRRDRRWCQGNLQHIRLLAEPGLHGLSRFHLVSGVFSYLAAPIWVILLALLSSGLISVWGFLPVLSIAAVLLIPKICALVDALPRARTAARRCVLLRAWGSELFLSTILAPIIMLRQASFVAAILMGRDCGWKSGKSHQARIPLGWAEAAVGAALATLALINATTGAFWLALVIVPLLSAPILLPHMNRVPA